MSFFSSQLDCDIPEVQIRKEAEIGVVILHEITSHAIDIHNSLTLFLTLLVLFRNLVSLQLKFKHKITL